MTLVELLLIAAVVFAFAPLARRRLARRSRSPELPPLVIPVSPGWAASAFRSSAAPRAIHRFDDVAPKRTDREEPVLAATGRGESVPVATGRESPLPTATDPDEQVTTPTVRFHRPGDEALQLLPGRLEVVAGEPLYEEIRFVRVPGEPPGVILGREPGKSPPHIPLRSSTVSRQHARLAFIGGRWTVANLSQTNPVVVNDEELSATGAERVLVDGDKLELGEVVLRFRAR